MLRKTSAILLLPAVLILLTVSLGALAFLIPAGATPGEYFRITVVDEATGRGVPLVELRTVNQVRFYTDSSGVAAVGDPDLMGQTVYYTITSPGYSYPSDGIGNRGVALRVTPGGSATVRIKRENIAERLYRLTGSGIYRDSILTGLPVPITHPLLDGQVMGQDTVEVTPYQHKLYWFFGDTDRPSYPLGQFATSGATSLPPGQGGLNPDVGVDLTYWVDDHGFSRPMIPLPHPPGPIWVGGLFTVTDHGRQRLLTNFAEVHHDMSIAVDGLAEFNDDRAVFEPICTYPKGETLHPDGHPFLVDNGGKRYLYFQGAALGAFPLVRVLPDIKHLTDSASYESFTCLKPGARYHGPETQLDRGPEGRLIWGWKKNTTALGEGQANALVSAGKMRPDELLTALRDVDTDAIVLSHGGSVFWNPYCQRWIMITTQEFGTPSFLGEVWFAEADTPVGPWLYARKIATHDHYTFYNPTQHPFFDQDGGRLIYFEGTYTDTFSDVKDVTPRYNYNQLMYRLALDDPRLSLPEPVYQLKQGDGTMGYAMRAGVQAAGAWKSVQSMPFYAVPPRRRPDGLSPIYAVAHGAGDETLQTARPGKDAAPLFYALPATPSPSEKSAPEIVPLYEYTASGTGRRWYATGENGHAPPTAVRAKQPLCRVWRNPSTVLALDDGARPASPPE